MSRSKRDHEGVLILDHRFTPGLSAEEEHAQGLPPGAGRGLTELPTYTCSHCQRVVIMNPQRTRERAYCRKCDHYICDQCGAVAAKTKECKTFEQTIEETQELAVKRGD